MDGVDAALPAAVADPLGERGEAAEDRREDDVDGGPALVGTDGGACGDAVRRVDGDVDLGFGAGFGLGFGAGNADAADIRGAAPEPNDQPSALPGFGV